MSAVRESYSKFPTNIALDSGTGTFDLWACSGEGKGFRNLCRDESVGGGGIPGAG